MAVCTVGSEDTQQLTKAFRSGTACTPQQCVKLPLRRHCATAMQGSEPAMCTLVTVQESAEPPATVTTRQLHAPPTAAASNHQDQHSIRSNAAAHTTKLYHDQSTFKAEQQMPFTKCKEVIAGQFQHNWLLQRHVGRLPL